MKAILSPCGTYRYRLDRPVQEIGLLYAYFGINPSTANAEEDDATSRKWIGFTRVFGGRAYIAANPFAYRATAVEELGKVSDPVGPDNEGHLLSIMAEADVLVPCWGNSGKIPKQLRHHLARLRVMLRSAGKPVKVFGFTKGGDPLHPLMLPYSTPLVPWNLN